jgi:hypothetical protein
MFILQQILEANALVLDDEGVFSLMRKMLTNYGIFISSLRRPNPI